MTNNQRPKRAGLWLLLQELPSRQAGCSVEKGKRNRDCPHQGPLRDRPLARSRPFKGEQEIDYFCFLLVLCS